MSEFLEFVDVSKNYGAIKASDHVSLSVKQGEFFSLLGPSGCGKTTLLRMLAGFESPDSGRILLDGQDITDIPPYHRKVNTIFQNYALFPHLSLWDNIAFGLRVAKRSKKEIKEQVETHRCQRASYHKTYDVYRNDDTVRRKRPSTRRMYSVHVPWPSP